MQKRAQHEGRNIGRGWLGAVAVTGWAVVLIGAARQEAELPIALLNTPRIIQESTTIQAMIEDASVEGKRLNEEVQALQERLRTLIEEYESQHSITSETENERRGAGIREVREEFEAKTDALREELMRTQAASVGPMREKILVILAEIAQERDIAIVLNAEATIYSKKTMDLTESVIERLDAGHEAAAAE